MDIIGIIAGSALQGYFAIGHRSDILSWGIAGIFGGWSL